jgi:hypothetical protein
MNNEIFYHRTPVADRILKNGFRNSSRIIGGISFVGVWLSDQPLDCNEGAKGDQLLEIVLSGALCDPYELIEDGKTYRESCVPSRIINRFGRVRLSAAKEGK